MCKQLCVRVFSLWVRLKTGRLKKRLLKVTCAHKITKGGVMKDNCDNTKRDNRSLCARASSDIPLSEDLENASQVGRMAKQDNK